MKTILPIIALILLGSPASAFSQEGAADSTYASVPARPGEKCIVCGATLTSDDIALIVRGRRVPLDKTMVSDFLRNREFYFARLEPKSALFQEELDAPVGTSQGGVSAGWFLVGLYVLLALICGGLSGYAAVSKGLRPISHFFVGFFFSVPGYIYVLTRPRASPPGAIPEGLVKVPVTSAPIPCPACGNENHPSAARCSVCGATLTPVVTSDVSRVVSSTH